MPRSDRKVEPIQGQPFRPDDPMFTIIVVDYEPSVPREIFRRKMANLAAQTCDDFEVLVYHDGPKSQTYEQDMQGCPMHPATTFVVTPTRVGDWGHSNRDLGIRAARGRWIIHTNADNVVFPNLIQVLKCHVTDPRPWVFALPPQNPPLGFRRLIRWADKRWNLGLLKPSLFESADPQILIYGVVMRGLVGMKAWHYRVPEASARQGVVLGGVPVQYGGTDAMQLVMRRELWLAEGGWYRREIDSDGLMYPEFARKYRVLPVPAVLGEHW